MEQNQAAPLNAPVILPAQPTQRSRLHRLGTAVWKERYLYALALPGIVFFLIFKYGPMWGIVFAFQNYSPYAGVFHSPWVGLQNFQQFLSSSDFVMLLRNTLGINTLQLLFFFPLPIVIALALNELPHERFKKVVQSIIYLPHFLSWVIVAGLTFSLFATGQGVVNDILAAMGLQRVQFLTNPHYFWIMITLQSMWKEAGWGTIIFLAAIAGVDVQLYEAAKIDGAGRLRQIWHVTLPAIRTVIVILLILRIGQIMDVGFEQIYLMFNGAVSQVADVFDTYVYRVGIQQGQFSFSTAVGLFKSIVGLILVVVSNRIAKRFGHEGIF